MHPLLLPICLLPSIQAKPFLLPRIDNPNPVLTASFTWNNKCGATVACGPSFAGIKGQGTTAANNITFAAGEPIVNGKGAGCGQCWHLQAMSNVFPNPNGKKMGTPVIAKITDQCTDGGYCDQTDSSPLNTGYDKQVHFDLCGETGTAPQFFGATGRGVLLGYAQLEPDCSRLKLGPQGSRAGDIDISDVADENKIVKHPTVNKSQGQSQSEEATSTTVPAAARETPTMTVAEQSFPTLPPPAMGNLSLPYRLPGGQLGKRPGMSRFSSQNKEEEDDDDEDDDDDGDECEVE